MKLELELKVQAWLDGELPDGEARQVGEWIAQDAEASALAAELGVLKSAMLHQETAARLDDSREFYWSKIERQIQKEAAPSRAPHRPWLARIRKWGGVWVGAAALACAMFLAVRQAALPNFDETTANVDGMEAVTFHDESAQMTVVWLQDNSKAALDDYLAPKEVRYHDEPDSVVDFQ